MKIIVTDTCKYYNKSTTVFYLKDYLRKAN